MILLNFYQQTLAQQQNGPAPEADYYLYVGDIAGFGIDWNGWLAFHWQPGQVVAPGFVCRPTVPNGYEYLCAAGGQTAGSQPPWGAAGATVNDGSAQWTGQVLSSASLATNVSSVVWTAQAPVVVSNPNKNGNIVAVVANTQACAVGTDYLLACAATMVDGTAKTGKFRLKVR